MLIITEQCQDKMLSAMKMAMDRGLLTGRYGLIDTLYYLAHYAEERGKQEGWDMATLLYPDFAPYSFGFDVRCRPRNAGWKSFMNGGLIYHGPAQEGESNLTVSLTSDEGWQTHT